MINPSLQRKQDGLDEFYNKRVSASAMNETRMGEYRNRHISRLCSSTFSLTFSFLLFVLILPPPPHVLIFLFSSFLLLLLLLLLLLVFFLHLAFFFFFFLLLLLCFFFFSFVASITRSLHGRCSKMKQIMNGLFGMPFDFSVFLQTSLSLLFAFLNG